MINRRAVQLALMATALATFVALPSTAAAAMRTIGGSWSAVPALPSAAAILTATGGADNRLYAFGFCQGTCQQTGGSVGFGSSVTYVFDPGDGNWHPRRPAPAQCSDAKASALAMDGTIRLAGCYADIVNDSGFRVAVYDTAANSWSLEPGMATYDDPLSGMTANDGRILWYSERLRSDGSAVFGNGFRVVVEAAAGGAWRAKALEPRNGPSDGAALGSDGFVYVAGGDRNCHIEFGACSMPPVERWATPGNTWTKPTVLPTARMRIGVTADARGRIFTIAGLAADGSRLFARVEVYRPDTGNWARAADLPDKRFGVVAASTPDGRVWVVGGYDKFGRQGKADLHEGRRDHRNSRTSKSCRGRAVLRSPGGCAWGR